MKKILKIVLFIFIGIVLIFAGGIFYLTRGLDTVSELTINEVDLSSLDDGTYTGKYETGRWANEVNVKIKDHEIIKISVIDDVLFSRPELTEKIFNRIIEKQNVKVDTITGATVSCKAYMKSIENALNK